MVMNHRWQYQKSNRLDENIRKAVIFVQTAADAWNVGNLIADWRFITLSQED